MRSAQLKKERWTLSFDKRLKCAVVKEAQRRGVSPVKILEEAVQKKLNPFGHANVSDSTAYVQSLRRKSRAMTDEEFLADLKQWEKVTS